MAAGFCHWILCWQHTNDSFLTADSFSSDFVQWFKAWCQARRSYCARPGTRLKSVGIMLGSATGTGFGLTSIAINFSKAGIRQINWICFLTWETGDTNRLCLQLGWKWCFFYFVKAGKGRLREATIFKLQTVKCSCNSQKTSLSPKKMWRWWRGWP